MSQTFPYSFTSQLSWSTKDSKYNRNGKETKSHPSLRYLNIVSCGWNGHGFFASISRLFLKFKLSRLTWNLVLISMLCMWQCLQTRNDSRKKKILTINWWYREWRSLILTTSVKPSSNWNQNEVDWQYQFYQIIIKKVKLRFLKWQ